MLLHKNILDLFSGTPSNDQLRNSDFYIPRFNSVKHGKLSLKFFGPRLWSQLSPGDRERERDVNAHLGQYLKERFHWLGGERLLQMQLSHVL